jgi:predicted permease
MTVPLWAALASLFVACVQPVQHALETHLQPVKGALASAGNCSIPVTLIVLGAYFHPPPENVDVDKKRPSLTTKPSTSLMNSARNWLNLPKSRPRRARRESSKAGETKTVIIAVASRMVITPLLLMPLMALSTLFDVQAVFEE